MKKRILIAAAAIFAIILVLSTIVIVPTGFTGVKVTFGQVSPYPVNPGLSLKVPFLQAVKCVNNKQQDMKIDTRIWSETSERTAIYYENITVTYSISPEYSAWIIANVNNYNNALITQDMVSSAIKTASKQLNSTDATNRGLIEPLTQECMQNIVNVKYGNPVLTINKIIISNVDFDESYNKAIASKQTAQIVYETQQIENQKIIEQAQKDAEVVRIQTEYQTAAKVKQAEADAEVKRIAAQAEAEANEKIAASLTPALINKMYYDRWDGKLPTMVTDGANLLINP